MAQARDANDSSNRDVTPIFSFLPEDDLPYDPVIADFESKPIAEIHDDLRSQGIDPEPTIRAIRGLLEDFRTRRSHHAAQTLYLICAAIVLTIRSRINVDSRPLSSGRAAPYPQPS